ncbi:MAG: OmpA family protein [Ignavibacteriales bacterium]|nr:OmpA family protein [Ignavibacteriales bacterium]
MKILLVLFVAFGFVVSEAQEKLFDGVESSIKEAENQSANILCAKDYEDALEHYTKAKTYFKDGNAIEEVQNELNETSQIITVINTSLVDRVKVFNLIVNARKDAISARGEKYTPVLFSIAENEFKNVVSDYSDGDVENITSSIQKIVLSYDKVKNYSNYADSLIYRWQPFQDAVSSLANLLSPTEYTEGLLKFNNAVENLAEGDEKNITDGFIINAGVLFNNATSNSKTFTSKYPDVIQIRKEAQTEGAETYAASLWTEAEETLADAGLAFENNEYEKGREKAIEAKEKYLSAKNLASGKESNSESENFSLSRNSWSFGFGFSYPRFISSNLTPSEGGYGGFLSLQRNFTEHVGLRLLGNYIHMEGKIGSFKQGTNLLSGNLDLLYYFVPCESVSPFISIGVGSIYYTFNQKFPEGSNKKYFLEYQLNFGFGVEWTLGKDWKLKSELDYHTPTNSNLDGIAGPNPGAGILGGSSDTYMSFDIGLVYYFAKGERSRLCDLYTGISTQGSNINYDKIEGIVKKYQSKPSDTVDYAKIDEIVKKYRGSIVASGRENLILVGVNFEFNSTRLNPESYPTLNDAVQILMQNPALKVEIQGHTDNIGSDSKNLNLSIARADTIKEYLISKGVESNRLSTVGFGSKKPVSDNKTEYGRSLNRRIEFKILN